METKRLFDIIERDIDTLDLMVVHNEPGRPVYHRDFISPYLMVLVCQSGRARALYDMQEVEFTANDVAVVLPNHIITPIETTPDYRVTIMVHSISLYEEFRMKRLTHDYNKFHLSPACRLTDEEMTNYMKTVDLVDHISRSSIKMYPLRHEMLIAQTNVSVEILNSYRRKVDEKVQGENHNYYIFSEFCDLLAEHYQEQHEVAFYASKVHLTHRHFSTIIKDVVGVSASDYIEQYIATQAKHMLKSRPDLSIQQISYTLGYAESPSFCRFFKRMTGFTPKSYRDKTITPMA